MSKSTLKLKHFEILDLSCYFKELKDDILQEEEDIIDIIYETSPDSAFILVFLIVLSKGTIIYLEYNTTNKKIIKIYRNTVLSSIITNPIQCCELSYSSPIVLSTTLNELILIETKTRPCQMINITEENILIDSVYCDYAIVDLKFNCTQSMILVTTTNQILLYRINVDKYQNKPVLQIAYEISLVGKIKSDELDYQEIINCLYIPKFSDFNDNILYITYTSDHKINDSFSKIFLENDETGPQEVFFLNIIQFTLNKKEYSTKIVKAFALERSLIKVKSSYFNERMFFLYEDGIICCVNTNMLKPNSDEIFDPKFVYKYSLNTSVKFSDFYIHPSSNFIIVKDTQNDFLIFDFTLNLYYIMNNSKISVKLNMNSFDKEERVKQVNLKSYEINCCIKNSMVSDLNSTVNNINKNNNLLGIGNNFMINDFKIDKNIKKIIFSKKLNNNSMFFYDYRSINGIFIQISSTFDHSQGLNLSMDELQLLKNHLRGQNFDSSFKILMMLQDFSLWLQALLLIVNKICYSPTSILQIKKHSLATILQYLKEKNFDDENKNLTAKNIKIICFTNLLYRCLAIKQYEYAYLIAEKLGQPYLFKVIMSHSRVNKFLGICYLASNKLETLANDSDDSVINDINKIITSSGFILSQSNMQLLVKDIDQILDSTSLNNDYMKENNTLEINLQKYMEGLKMEMEGKFDEAKEIYKLNNLNYDYMRVEKMNKELISQLNDECVIEFNDF